MKNKSALLGKLKIDRQEEDSSFSMPISMVIGIVTLTVIFVFIGFYFFSSNQTSLPNDAQSQNEMAVDEVETPLGSGSELGSFNQVQTKVKKDDRILNASGYITARRMATVSSQIMGLITDVLVEEGMAVSEGQVLARLDNEIALVDKKLAEGQVALQKSRLGSVMVNLAEAERVLVRASKLKVENFSSEASVTRAQTDVDILKATIQNIEADIRVAELGVQRQDERVKNHVIRAPFSGIVTVKNAQPGEIVAPSSAGGGFTRTGICTIVDMDSLEIEVDVNEAFIGRISKGQRVEAKLDAYPEWQIAASVIAIIPTADRARATVRVRIKIETKDDRILPDMGVRVAFLKL
ncbi:MAG: efflux RND transporter periplasmic adaptor subunit [Sphingomonadales bacterium]